MNSPSVLYRNPNAMATRRQILARAMDIASAEGLGGLSIGRLALELKMSKTGVFAHFGSKQRLQLATVDAARQVFMQQVVQPTLHTPRGLPRLRSLLENWLGYVERIVFRGGCFFAAASAEFDSRPGPIRDEIAVLTRAWLTALEKEIAFAKRQEQIGKSTDPAQLVFELHAAVQEANWAFKLFNSKSAFVYARRAIAAHIASVSLNKVPKQRRKDANQ